MVPLRKSPAAKRSPRRSFDGIRQDILETLSSGRMTVSEVSRRTDINWKTVDNHLIYLCGRGWAEKVFDSPSVKIFEISEPGLERLERVRRKAAIAAVKESVRQSGELRSARSSLGGTGVSRAGAGIENIPL